MCSIIIENINRKNTIEIFLTSDDFKNVEKVENIDEYKNSLYFNIYLYINNIDKANEIFSKTIIKKLSSYIIKYESLNLCKINFMKFSIYDKNVIVDINSSSFTILDI